MNICKIVIIAAVIFVSCNSSTSHTSNETSLILASDTTAVRYQCPMKCQGDTAYTTKGQCPVCEMDIVQL
jgi:Heavy metal binding domain